MAKVGKKPVPELEMFVSKLNTASVTTRYPDDLAQGQVAYTAEVTKELLTKSKEVLQWVKMQL